MDCPRNMISNDEYEMIDEAIQAWNRHYDLSDADTCNQADVRSILHVWEREKSKFLWDLFGHQLHLQKEIHYQMKDNELRDHIYEAVTQCAFVKAFHHRFDMYSRDLQDTIIRGDKWELFRLLEPAALATNRYEGSEIVLMTENGDIVKVNPGCKISKVLGKIAEAFNLPHYEDFRLRHSMALNNVSVDSTLHLSIHPLDYITMSDNNYNWESCMSWLNSGSYCRGTVEMMNSPCVVVAYISNRNMDIYDGEWNDKRWRELFVVNEDLAIEVCPYPYENKDLTKMVLDWIKELAEKNLNIHYRDEVESLEFDEGNSSRFSFYTNTMYNDFRYIHMFYATEKIYEETSDYNVAEYGYSGPDQCMWCGETYCEFEDEGQLICESCARSVRCCCCGDRVSPDYCYEVDGELYCEDCYNENCAPCACCGDIHNEEYYDRIYLGREIDHGEDCECVYEAKLNICPDCMKEAGKRFFRNGSAQKSLRIRPNAWFGDFVTVEDLTQEGYDAITENVPERLLKGYEYHE